MPTSADSSLTAPSSSLEPPLAGGLPGSLLGELFGASAYTLAVAAGRQALRASDSIQAALDAATLTAPLPGELSPSRSPRKASPAADGTSRAACLRLVPAASPGPGGTKRLSVHQAAHRAAREIVLEASPSLFASRWRQPPITEGWGHSWRQDWLASHVFNPRVHAAPGAPYSVTLASVQGRARPLQAALVHVTSASATSLAWLQGLRAGLQGDVSWQDNAEISFVAGAALERLIEEGLHGLNEPMTLEADEAQGPASSLRQHLCVVVDTASGAPVGYCAYSLRWDVQPEPAQIEHAQDGGLTLELDVQEAWLSPRARGQGLGVQLQRWLAQAATGAVADFERKLGMQGAQAGAPADARTDAPLVTKPLELKLVLTSNADAGGVLPSRASTGFMGGLLRRLQQLRSAQAGGAVGQGMELGGSVFVNKVVWEG